MRLTLKRYGDGRLRPRWYGDYERDGKRRVATLCRWLGTPPESGAVGDRGDDPFEASRQAALAELRQAVEGEKTEADKSALAERIHRARYGGTIEHVRLAELPERWAGFPRKRRPTKRHADNIRGILSAFIAYMTKHAPEVAELGAVTGKHVQEFMDAQEARGISGRTFNVYRSALRSVFRRLDPHAGAFRDYLAVQPKREELTIHRAPFTGDELRAVFAAAESDALLRPLVVCAACTAMRRGDVATLRWRHVDLSGGMLTVKTAKTGEPVEIPILPPLRAELERARRGPPDGFVWPDAAALYKHAPYALDRRLRAILARAGFVRPPKPGATPAPAPAPTLPALPREETEARGMAAIAATGWTDKRRRHTGEIFKRYMAGGESVKAIAAATDSSVGTVSMALNSVESMIGAAVVRRPPPPPAPAQTAGILLAPKAEGASRLLRGSLRGWHAFRTTFVTMALSAGVPSEVVKLVTGHTTLEVVSRHYFRPGREAMRAAIQEAMPAALLAGPKALPAVAPLDWRAEIRRIAEGLTPKSAKNAKAQLLALATREP